MTSGHDGEDFGFQIAPMVDVVFVLLLFFMACAAQQTLETELKIMPSGRRAPTDGQIIPMMVDVDSAGNVFVNNQPYSAGPGDAELIQLRQMLAQNHENAPEDPVFIRPHNEVRHGRIMQVLNACTAAEVRHIGFATQ